MMNCMHRFKHIFIIYYYYYHHQRLGRPLIVTTYLMN